ncbi:MAG TPA: class I SAM-dependent methyltransferase [Thermoanaerobaculia bacterium]|nr:class I SAM-dependent methyltransferase [Thermoanaerobaculia bacterium]
MGKRRAAQKVLQLLSAIPARVAPKRWKEWHELLYWKLRKRAEGVLGHGHYAHFYTTHFGLDASSYAGKVVLDIGCGPRGSLEWAGMAARRIGLDPLAEQYLAMGADRHRMEYIASPAETIPLPDGACDIVCSFNSLDHVDDVDRTANEIKRVTRTGGLFLLLVEVNHPPTACEPHLLTPRRIHELFEPEFRLQQERMYPRAGKGLYDSIRQGEPLREPAEDGEGFLSVLFVRE